MSEWKSAPLGDLAEVKLGKMLDQKKNQGDYKPYLGNDNVQWNEFNLEEVKEMRFKEDELERFRLKSGDLMVCEGGDPGRCALWERDDEVYYQKALHRVRIGEELDARYLLYFMLHIGATKEIRQYYTGGATIKHLPNAALKGVVIRFPDIDCQRRIAGLLKDFDALIDNCRRQIKLLEEAAQRLYREWFVDMRFPGHESAEFVDGLPAGWKRAHISDEYDVVKGCSYTSSTIDSDSGIPMITLASVKPFGGLKPYLERQYCGKHVDEQVLNTGDVVMALTEQAAGLAGYTARIPRYANGYLPSMDLVVLRPKEGTREYLYASCAYGSISRELSPLANGTKIKHLKPEVFSYMDIVVPPIDLQKKYADVVSPFYSQQDLLYEATFKAADARDRLLPKLMSGEIEV